jgi:hypothetical protein
LFRPGVPVRYRKLLGAFWSCRQEQTPPKWEISLLWPDILRAQVNKCGGTVKSYQTCWACSTKDWLAPSDGSIS